MAAHAFNRSAVVPAFVSNIGRVFGLLSAWNDTRAMRRSLAGLSDRDLDDLGLTRGDVNRGNIPH